MVIVAKNKSGTVSGLISQLEETAENARSNGEEDLASLLYSASSEISSLIDEIGSYTETLGEYEIGRI